MIELVIGESRGLGLMCKLDLLVGGRRSLCPKDQEASASVGCWERVREGLPQTSLLLETQFTWLLRQGASFWATHEMPGPLQQGASSISFVFLNKHWCETQPSLLQRQGFSDLYFTLSLVSLDPGLKYSYLAVIVIL